VGRGRRPKGDTPADRKLPGAGKYYMISVVANSYGIHPQTLRLYEREGLLKPSRTDGNTRLYSEEDLRQLEVILNLTRDLGVNLAGIEIVLNMRRKMEQMQAEMAKALQMWASTMSRDVAARLVQGFLVRLYAPSQRKPRNVRLSLGFPPIRTPMIPVCWEVREAHLQVDKIG